MSTSSHRCPVCGHVNRVGTEICGMCDARLTGGPHEGEERSSPYEAGGYYPRQEAEDVPEGALPTDIPSPFFKGAGDVISPTLDVYRKNFPLVGALVLVTSLPLVALQYGAYLMMSAETNGLVLGDAADASPLLFLTEMGGMVLLWLLTLLGNALLAGSLAYAVVELQRTGSARVGDSLRWGLRKLPKLAFVNVLYFLGVYGLGFFLLGLTAAILGPAIMILLCVLLVAPWLIFNLMFSLIVPAATIENRSIIGSFVRSAELTKGYKGLIFLTYFLWGLLVAVVGLIVSGSFSLGGTNASVLGALVQTLISQMLGSTTAVLTVFIFLGILNEGRQGFDNRVITPMSNPEEIAR